MGGSGVDIALDLLLLGDQQGPERDDREEESMEKLVI